ncbi:MAG: hypothetical protein IPL65_01090 [Lewinellaceae bacterium]|nr:hypothetical protein [Lewinellaceae bacterium]
MGTATVNAQSCHGAAAAGKSCCASKASAAATSDATIEKRMNEDGSMAYVRKEADTQGNVKFVSVQFDEKSNTFVNVAPATASANATPVATEGMTKKSCAAMSSGKACCADKAKEGKACCAGKAKAAADQK